MSLSLTETSDSQLSTLHRFLVTREKPLPISKRLKDGFGLPLSISSPEYVWETTKVNNEWSGMSVPTVASGKGSGRGSLDHWIRSDLELKPHQVEGVKWLKTKRGAILGDEMGLGKTVQMLCTFGMQIWDTVRLDPSRRLTMVAVVPPTLRINWAEEVEKFTHIDFELIEGGLIERFQQLERFRREIDKHRIIIMNYQQIKHHIQQLNAFGIDMLVFDEAHTIKNPLSQVYKTSAALKSKRTFCMTGTPMMNQVDDLWTLLDLVVPGQWGTHGAFKAKFCVMGEGHSRKQVVAIKNETLLRTKLSQVMLRRRIDDVLDLPEVNIVKRDVSLDGLPKEMYNHLVKNQDLDPWVPWVPKDPDDEKEVNPLSWPMVRQLKLRQICSSTATILHDQDVSPKLELAVEDAVELIQNGHKIVVFTQWRHVLNAYIRRLKKVSDVPIFEIHGDVSKDKRQGIVKAWEEVEGASVCVGIIKAMATGLNMTAANHAQFIDKEFSPALNEQGVGRLRRIGSEKHNSIQVFEYFVRNSCEARVEAIIKDKNFANELIVEGAAKSKGFMEKLSAALEGTI